MQKPDGITFELCSFTCEEIEKILTSSHNVRDIATRSRDKYLQSMMNGDWNCANGDVLVFDKEGKCLDGQHRLSAAYAYQKATGDNVWFWCAKNAEPKAALTKDQGLLRSLSAVLKREGVPLSHKCASIVNSQLNLQESKRNLMCLRTSVCKAVLSVQYQCWLDNRESVAEVARLAEKAKDARLSRSTLFGQVIYEIRRQCGDEAITFANAVITGIDLNERDPAYLLRRRLLTDYTEIRQKMSAEYSIALMVTAWNNWIRGIPMQQLRWIQAGPKACPFPTLYIPSKEAVKA